METYGKSKTKQLENSIIHRKTNIKHFLQAPQFQSTSTSRTKMAVSFSNNNLDSTIQDRPAILWLYPMRWFHFLAVPEPHRPVPRCLSIGSRCCKAASLFLLGLRMGLLVPNKRYLQGILFRIPCPWIRQVRNSWYTFNWTARWHIWYIQYLKNLNWFQRCQIIFNFYWIVYISFFVNFHIEHQNYVQNTFSSVKFYLPITKNPKSILLNRNANTLLFT